VLREMADELKMSIVALMSLLIEGGNRKIIAIDSPLETFSITI